MIGLKLCHHCKFNAGVMNGKTKCLKLKKEVQMDIETGCSHQDSSSKPGKVLHITEFMEAIKK